MHVKILVLLKDDCVEKVCPANLALLMFRHITWNQLNNLTLIDMFSCLGGLEGTYQTAARKFPCSILGFGKTFVLFILCCLNTHYMS